MQKYIRPVSLVAFLTLFVGALFSLAGVGTTLFYVGIAFSFLLLFFILLLAAFMLFKNASIKQKFFISSYLFSIMVTSFGLVLRFLLSNAPNYKFRHYTDVGFQFFFSGLVLLGLLLVTNLLYIIFFTREEDFVK